LGGVAVLRRPDVLSAREIFGEILLPGDAGTGQTLDRMRALVDVGAQLPETRQAVAAALTSALPRNPQSELSALLEWVQERWHYVRDPTTVELVQTPALMLREIRLRGEVQGDCDDAAVLFAALAESAGYPTRFVVQGPAGDLFRHVVIEVQAGGRWLAVDPSQGVHGLGWTPPAGREAREMRYRRNGLGQSDVVETAAYWPTEYYAPVTPSGDVVTAIQSVLPSTAPAPTGGGWLTDVGSVLKGLVTTVLPVAERYGVVKPIVGYSAAGQPIYATSTIPVGGAQGALFTGLTQVAFLGLTWGQVLLIGGGGLLLLRMLRR
jgi:Transglutaminase-like superfamily